MRPTPQLAAQNHFMLQAHYCARTVAPTTLQTSRKRWKQTCTALLQIHFLYDWKRNRTGLRPDATVKRAPERPADAWGTTEVWVVTTEQAHSMGWTEEGGELKNGDSLSGPS